MTEGFPVPGATAIPLPASHPSSPPPLAREASLCQRIILCWLRYKYITGQLIISFFRKFKENNIYFVSTFLQNGEHKNKSIDYPI